MSTTGDWFLRFCPPAAPSIRLVCLPGAASSASMFHPWSAELGPDVEVCAVVPPGRGPRFREAPLTRMRPYVEGVVEALRTGPYLPLVLFGHSLGGLIAYEIAQRLRDVPEIDLRALVVAAHKAPRLGSAGLDPRPLRDAEVMELLEWPGLAGGVPPDGDLRRLVVAAARADFELDYTYRYQERGPLATTLHVHGGKADPLVPDEQLSAWRSHAAGDFRLWRHPGGHFFLTGEGREPLLATLRPLLHEKGDLRVPG